MVSRCGGSYFVEAKNSLHEVVGAMDLAEAIGAVPASIGLAEIQPLAVRLRGMLVALIR